MRVLISGLPGAPLVTSGPYRYFSHPNYAVVVAEIALLPLALHLPLLQIADQSWQRDRNRHRKSGRNRAETREGQFRRRSRLGDQTDRNRGLSGAIQWPASLARYQIRSAVRFCRLNSESFLSRPESSRRARRFAGFTFGDQRVSLLADSRSGSDAQI